MLDGQPRACWMWESDDLICKSLRAAKLHDAAGNEVAAVLTSCSPLAAYHQVDVTWTTPEGAFLYEGSIDLDEQVDRYEPVRIWPSVRAFPCEDQRCATMATLSASVSIPAIPKCSRFALAPGATSVALTPPGAEKCDERASRNVNRLACWGRVPSVAYHVRYMNWRRVGFLEAIVSSARTRYSYWASKRELSPEVSRELFSKLDAKFWELPLEGGRCGRVGYSYSVVGRSQGRFRVVSRGCRDIADTLGLLEKEMDADLARRLRVRERRR